MFSYIEPTKSEYNQMQMSLVEKCTLENNSIASFR